MTEDDLVAAIRAAPDDDAPRMVYADWLQARGDPLGEWIALSLGLGLDGLPFGSPRRRDAERRLDALAVELAWQQRFGVDVGFERGLVSKLSLPARDLTRPDAAWRGTLVRELALVGRRPPPDKRSLLADAIARMAVRALRVEWQLDRDELAALLAACPDLVALELAPTQLGDALGNVIADAHLPQLARLVATGHAWEREAYQLGDRGAEALAEAAWGDSLRELVLRELRIGAPGAATLADGRLPLDVLDLSRNPIGPAGVIAMLRQPGIRRLRTLALAGCGIDDAVASAIAGTRALAQLRRLVLWEPGVDSLMTAAAIGRLERSPNLSRRLELVVWRDSIDD